MAKSSPQKQLLIHRPATVKVQYVFVVVRPRRACSISGLFFLVELCSCSVVLSVHWFSGNEHVLYKNGWFSWGQVVIFFLVGDRVVQYNIYWECSIGNVASKLIWMFYIHCGWHVSFVKMVIGDSVCFAVLVAIVISLKINSIRYHEFESLGLSFVSTQWVEFCSIRCIQMWGHKEGS